jgi:hypothetical protein
VELIKSGVKTDQMTRSQIILSRHLDVCLIDDKRGRSCPKVSLKAQHGFKVHEIEKACNTQEIKLKAWSSSKSLYI